MSRSHRWLPPVTFLRNVLFHSRPRSTISHPLWGICTSLRQSATCINLRLSPISTCRRPKSTTTSRRPTGSAETSANVDRFFAVEGARPLSRAVPKSRRRRSVPRGLLSPVARIWLCEVSLRPRRGNVETATEFPLFSDGSFPSSWG